MQAAWLLASLAIFAVGFDNLTVYCEIANAQDVEGHLNTIQDRIINGASGTVKTKFQGRISSEEIQTNVGSKCPLKVYIKLATFGNHLVVSGITVCKSGLTEKNYNQKPNLKIKKACSNIEFTGREGKVDITFPRILPKIRHVKHKLSGKHCAAIQFDYGT